MRSRDRSIARQIVRLGFLRASLGVSRRPLALEIIFAHVCERMRKKLLFAFLFLFVVAQLIRPAKNLNAHPQPDDIFAQQPASDEVRVLIEHSCYDCHSNNTRYPWYAEIQPVGWWLADHIKEGKAHVNFSEFGRYDAKRAARKLEQSSESIDDGSMPLASYSLIHRDARFTTEQKKKIMDWLDGIQERLQPSEK